MTRTVLLMTLAGCGSLFGPRPIVEGDGFFDRPFPDDRRRVNGHPDLRSFPHIKDVGLLQKYVAEAERLDGFGIHSPLHLRFDGPLNLRALPTPRASCAPGAAVLLLNLDPDSPAFGERVPFAWDFQEDETRWQPENLLSVQPVWGFGLLPATTYALVITRDIARPPRGFAKELDQAPRWQPLRDWLFLERSAEDDLSIDDIAYAFTFTTQDPTLDLARIVHRQRTALNTDVVDPNLRIRARFLTHTVFSGTLRLPQWQQGQAPFSEGGHFAFDDGWPRLVRMEAVTFGLAVPGGQAPGGGWPLVIFLHGTGSDWSSWTLGGESDIAGRLASRGIASLSISLPLHGDRFAGGNPELLTFNLLNPESARTNFRQAAAEVAWLAQVFTEHQWVLGRPEGRQITLDPRRVAYMGHSHGAVVGAIAAPFLPDAVDTVVLSGAGGGLSVSAVRRDAGDFDIQAILGAALSLAPGEELDELHPVMGLVQLLSDATDPLSYAPHWQNRAPWWQDTPRNVLMFEGTDDIYTPPRTIRALAGAGRLPHLGARSVTSPIQRLVPLHQPGPGPFVDNLPAWDDAPVTGGVVQFPGEGHFVIFQNPDAERIYLDFLETALSAGPEVILP